MATNDSARPDGGAAFPTEYSVGMTLRDWFAGQALVGLLASPWLAGHCARRINELCFLQADAMIAAREVRG